MPQVLGPDWTFWTFPQRAWNTKGMKKILLLAIFFAVGCASLSGWKEPKVDLKDLYIKDTNLVGTTIVFVLSVENTNEREIKVDEVNYKISLDGQAFANSKTQQPVVIAPKASAPVEIPLPVRYVDLFAHLNKALNSSQIEYAIEGDAKMSFFKVPFKKQGHLKLTGP